MAKMTPAWSPVSFCTPHRSSLASSGASGALTSDAEVDQACLPPYDVGALKALFHHVKAVLEEKHHTLVVRGSGQSRGSLSRSFAGPEDRDNDGAGASPSAPRCEGGVAKAYPTGDNRDDDGASGREEWKMFSTLKREGEKAIGDTKSGLQKFVSPLESARILGEIAHRVSDLEARVLPGATSDEGASMVGAEAQPTLALGPGGAFARLVVIKELQPVPDHAPEDARHLLELTLDHQQVISLPWALVSVPAVQCIPMTESVETCDLFGRAMSLRTPVIERHTGDSFRSFILSNPSLVSAHDSATP